VTELVCDLAFIGIASDTATHMLKGCTLSRSNGATILRCTVIDQAALHLLIDRIYGLDLELVAIHKVSEIIRSEQPHILKGQRRSGGTAHRHSDAGDLFGGLSLDELAKVANLAELNEL
jgi:hypothetical protein